MQQEVAVVVSRNSCNNQKSQRVRYVIIVLKNILVHTAVQLLISHDLECIILQSASAVSRPR